jgi:hypothetical protein
VRPCFSSIMPIVVRPCSFREDVQFAASDCPEPCKAKQIISTQIYYPQNDNTKDKHTTHTMIIQRMLISDVSTW